MTRDQEWPTLPLSPGEGDENVWLSASGGFTLAAAIEDALAALHSLPPPTCTPRKS